MASRKLLGWRSYACDLERCFLHVWPAGGTLSHVWVALCGDRMHQAMSHCRFAKLGRQDLWCSSGANDIKHSCKAAGSCPKRMVCRCKGTRRVGRCEFTGDGSGPQHLNTDSLCVYHWVTDALTGKSWLNTKSASEMLIQWWLEALNSLVKECDLLVTIALV